MLLLVSGATRTVDRHDVGHLIVPKAWTLPTTLKLQPHRWAMDNGAFSGFDAGAFVRMLEAYQGYQGYQCLFVTAPDVVADAAATLAFWPFWSQLIRGCGYRPAFVAQDGLDPARVPWTEMGALFIGGTTGYKESTEVRSLMAYAKARGMWTHWGRVNSQRRYELAAYAGCDSIDGSGFSKWPDANIPKAAQWERQIQQQPSLL